MNTYRVYLKNGEDFTLEAGNFTWSSFNQKFYFIFLKDNVELPDKSDDIKAEDKDTNIFINLPEIVAIVPQDRTQSTHGLKVRLKDSREIFILATSFKKVHDWILFYEGESHIRNLYLNAADVTAIRPYGEKPVKQD